MRWPSGDRTASPTNRKRGRSLLVKPCALLNGARARSTRKLKKREPARSPADCLRACMEFSLTVPSLLDGPGHPRSPGVLRSTKLRKENFSKGEFLRRRALAAAVTVARKCSGLEEHFLRC